MNYIERMNYYGKVGEPFLFIIDYDRLMPIIIPLIDINSENIMFDIKGKKNFEEDFHFRNDFHLIKNPPSYEDYLKAYKNVEQNLKLGNSYLINLTLPTEIKTNFSLLEIFHHTSADYKLYIKDNLVLFSPETFVEIKEGRISSHPMKGTIDANIPDAETRILNDEKEIAEHNTIVDLIRNDLSMVAKNVEVKRYRYITSLQKTGINLLQVSSEIAGYLPENYAQNIGTIISTLLPAGSITGAPKAKTVEVIKESENYNRGYYTGVFGMFDGLNLDSAVMIRYIEQHNNKFYFKSGGGITIFSKPEKEYKELVDKVNVPIIRNY